MRKRVMGGLCLLMLVAGTAALWRFDLGAVPHAKAQAQAPDIPVTPGVVIARDMPEYLNGIGTVQAFNAVAVRPRVDGPIVRVAFTEGQEVKQGDLLFQIDPRPYEATLEQALANRQKDIAQLQTAQMDLDRYSRLVGSGFQTRQSYDQQKGLVAQLQAAIKGDDAQIDTAKLNLSFTEIRSPIDGRLGARLVDIGNLVHASDSTSLVTITQLKPIFVSFTLPQNALDDIRQHQQQAPLAVQAVTSDGKTVLGNGKLTLIDNTIDQNTETIHLKAEFANLDERLWPGAFVNVRLELLVRHNVATVPSQAVQEGADGDFAYVIRKDDTVERRSIKLVGVQDGLAVIRQGLQPGERVVVAGQYRLVDGARVSLRQPDTTKPAG